MFWLMVSNSLCFTYSGPYLGWWSWLTFFWGRMGWNTTNPCCFRTQPERLMDGHYVGHQKKRSWWWSLLALEQQYWGGLHPNRTWITNAHSLREDYGDGKLPQGNGGNGATLSMSTRSCFRRCFWSSSWVKNRKESWTSALVLVGGLEHFFIFFPYLGNFIIPIDALIFFRGVGQPPTSKSLSLILVVAPLPVVVGEPEFRCSEWPWMEVCETYLWLAARFPSAFPDVAAVEEAPRSRDSGESYVKHEEHRNMNQ